MARQSGDGSRPLRGAERRRLREDAERVQYWRRWGPYLADRQWGTVREDYSADGDAWASFPHDHARSRAYRWGEDGLLGICDRAGRLCLALALWNERDPILKERLFGLTGPEGNHGEDPKEAWFHLDATPTSSYLKALYKYPQAAFPYERLREENARRGRDAPEFELHHTGVFDDGRYFDVTVEYAKASPEDVLVRIVVANRASEDAVLHVLPTLWFRNVWSWGRSGDGYGLRPQVWRAGERAVGAAHPVLGERVLEAEQAAQHVLFTDNETHAERLYGKPSASPYVKDAFHAFVVEGRRDAVNPAERGTKAAFHHRLEVPARGHAVLRLRFRPAAAANGPAFDADFERVFDRRIQEAHAFYEEVLPPAATIEERLVARQAYAGLLWSKQFYFYVVADWLEGDPALPPPPPERRHGRNHRWRHLYNRDVISMPDTWEYPWYAAWDLAFHMLPFARIDPDFARAQLLLFLREWYMHPNGQIPAYEYALGDVNPPVHAWAAWQVHRLTDGADRRWLARVFQKLLLNFTWWVNRKDADDNNLFSGGFLGLDNIGVFDRSHVPQGTQRLEQADGTAWMAFYCGSMLQIALDLAVEEPAYEDMASKFFEHFVGIVDAMNTLGGGGLWDEADGFYYDKLHRNGTVQTLRIRSMVGVIPLFAATLIEESTLERLPEFRKRMQWFLDHRTDLARHVAYCARSEAHPRRLLAVPSRERLIRVLRYVLDENEFLSPYGVRSLSRVHAEHPFELDLDGVTHRVAYAPGESDTDLFGGNSNWRGPVWFPLNMLLIEALETYHAFYGDDLQVECPTGSGRRVNLAAVADEIRRRLVSLFLPDAEGRRPSLRCYPAFTEDPHWHDLVLFHEYFHGDNGCGLGAEHQTGWTALVTRLLDDLAAGRQAAVAPAPRETRAPRAPRALP